MLGTPVSSGEAAYSFTTGSPGFNAATSALGSPCVTVPIMSVGGMPVGVQLIDSNTRTGPSPARPHG